MITDQKNREAQQQRRVELYARLASLPSLDTLKAKEKTALVSLAKQGGYKLLDSADIMRKPPKWHQRAEKEWEKRKPSQEEVEKALHEDRKSTFEEMMSRVHYVNLLRWKETRREPLPMHWDAIRAAYPLVRRLIGELFGNGFADIPPSQNATVVTLDSGQVTEHYVGPDAPEELLFDFLQTIKQQSFPFRQCPRCRTIFPRLRKQKFCSLSCRAEAFSYAENPDRKQQVKDAVKRFRENKGKPNKTEARAKGSSS